MMIKILINAYAVSPHTGSEPGMAWNWCSYLAKYCELHIITEGEFKVHIEKALETLPQSKNMHFYYNPVATQVREMCWNQGDWRFYKHYKKWQYKTYEMAVDICRKETIDAVHQLNMIGFREPGYLWKIKELPFIWGPIGGLKQFPVAYLRGAGLKTQLFVRLKNLLNVKQLQYDQRVNKALNRASLLISSIPDSYNAIKKYKGLESVIITETGCFSSENISKQRFENNTFDIMWVGKFDFRKQLPIALKSIATTKNKYIKLHVYGSGGTKQEENVRNLTSDLGIDNQIIWHGNQPHQIVQEAMQRAQLFFFTSVSEDTSTVVMEAISNHLPVLCFDTCGMGQVINNKVGRKIPLSTPNESVSQFAEQLHNLYNNREELQTLANNCALRQKELSWDQKAVIMMGLYQNII
ncbi:glycosyltransferase family 4 protein [Maribacter sp. Asnod1-A12]|uniref:glycosyltransferase family 4 protein n=1 Tax=Maribacter sp. Asnod1-A12 TaxID=3160576 RepID=UPI00386F990E